MREQLPFAQLLSWQPDGFHQRMAMIALIRLQLDLVCTSCVACVPICIAVRIISKIEFVRLFTGG